MRRCGTGTGDLDRGTLLVDAEVGDRRLQLLGLAASSSEVADICSEALAFCWVTLSSCWIAWLIWSAPISCSRQAALISSTSSAVFLMSGTSLASISPASCAAFTVCADKVPISAAAVWLRSASLRTSEATTAKPLPCSPARAASTAAFSASRSVWRAISCTMVILLGDGLHRLDRAADRLAARLRVRRRLAGDLLGLAGVVGVLLDVGGHLLHRGGGFLGRGRLLGGALRHCSALDDSSWLPDETLSDAAIASPTTERKR